MNRNDLVSRLGKTAAIVALSGQLAGCAGTPYNLNDMSSSVEAGRATTVLVGNASRRYANCIHEAGKEIEMKSEEEARNYLIACSYVQEKHDKNMVWAYTALDTGKVILASVVFSGVLGGGSTPVPPTPPGTGTIGPGTIGQTGKYLIRFTTGM